MKGDEKTYTGATEVTGPGSVGRVGKGVKAHWMKYKRPFKAGSINTYGLLDVGIRQPSREVGVAHRRRRNRDLRTHRVRIQLSLVMGSSTYHVRAVNHLAHVLAKDRKLGHGSLERDDHLNLVVLGHMC